MPQEIEAEEVRKFVGLVHDIIFTTVVEIAAYIMKVPEEERATFSKDADSDWERLADFLVGKL